MDNITTRRPRTSEIPALRHIWVSSFGNQDEAAGFFRFLFSPELCLVVEREGIYYAMGHLIPVGDLVLGGGQRFPCAMIYAVAVLPEHRSCGIGTVVSAGLISAAHSAGYPAVVLCPASDRLFEFYSTRTEMQEWFYVNEYTLSTQPSYCEHATLMPVSSREYAEHRESMLSHIPHIVFNERSLEYQNHLCGLYGGGFFLTESPTGLCCALIERQSEDIVWVKELIVPKNASKLPRQIDKAAEGRPKMNLPAAETAGYQPQITGTTQQSCGELNPTRLNCGATSAIASAFPAAEYLIRTPTGSQMNIECVGSIISKTRRFAMLAPTSELADIARADGESPWCGLAFD